MKTSLRCPMRCRRPIRCSSRTRLHGMSQLTITCADCRSMPSPPASVETRTWNLPARKSCCIRSRSRCSTAPSSVSVVYPAAANRPASQRAVSANSVNTSSCPEPGSRSCRSSSLSSSAHFDGSRPGTVARRIVSSVRSMTSSSPFLSRVRAVTTAASARSHASSSSTASPLNRSKLSWSATRWSAGPFSAAARRRSVSLAAVRLEAARLP